jgi:hypothetical protein
MSEPVIVVRGESLERREAFQRKCPHPLRQQVATPKSKPIGNPSVHLLHRETRAFQAAAIAVSREKANVNAWFKWRSKAPFTYIQ